MSVTLPECQRTALACIGACMYHSHTVCVYRTIHTQHVCTFYNFLCTIPDHSHTNVRPQTKNSPLAWLCHARSNADSCILTSWSFDNVYTHRTHTCRTLLFAWSCTVITLLGVLVSSSRSCMSMFVWFCLWVLIRVVCDDRYRLGVSHREAYTCWSLPCAFLVAATAVVSLRERTEVDRVNSNSMIRL
jgi:hypothetical protein